MVVPLLEADLAHVQEMVHVEEAPRLDFLRDVLTQAPEFGMGVGPASLLRPQEEVEEVEHVDHETGPENLE